MNNITAVSSDHVDPASLATAAPGGSDAGVNVSFFTLHGQPDLDPLLSPGAGIVNEYSALSIPAFYSGVRFISETIAGLPRRVYKRTKDGPERDDSHPMNWTLNDQVNELQVPFVFWSTFIAHACNWSNAFAAVRRQPGQDTELYNLPPDCMIPFRFNGQQWFAYDKGKPDDPNKPNSRYLIFSGDEIIHLPAFSFDGMSGMRMVKLMQQSLSTARATERYVGKYYAQGGLMGGSIETDKTLTTDQIKDLINLVRNEYSGEKQAHKWMVLANGAKAKSLNPQLDTGQTAENRAFSVLEVCRMLRVPPHIVYDLGRATWGNIESLGIEVVKYTLNNWIVPLEQELSRKLLTRAERKAGSYISLDTAAIMRGDHAAQTDQAIKRVNNGLSVPDEERRAMQLPPYPNGVGSIPRVQGNTLPLVPVAAAPAASTTPPASTKEKPDDMARLSTPPASSPTPAGAADLRATLGPLIADAAARVGAKTAKATENARKKFQNNPVGFTAWGNVFADEQAGYAAAAAAPILATHLALLGEGQGRREAVAAAGIGQQYARGLRLHLAHPEEPAPDLSVILFDSLEIPHE